MSRSTLLRSSDPWRSGRLPGFGAERATAHRSPHHYRATGSALVAPPPTLLPASCSYHYGACAGAHEMSCEFGDSSGICVGSGYAPVVVTCDGDVSFTEAPCVV